MARDANAWIDHEIAGCRFADERLGRLRLRFERLAQRPLDPRADRIRPAGLSITHIVCSWRGMDVGPYPTERDGPTPVGTSVARGGADGPRRECLDRSRDRRMPVRRRAEVAGEDLASSDVIWIDAAWNASNYIND